MCQEEATQQHALQCEVSMNRYVRVLVLRSDQPLELTKDITTPVDLRLDHTWTYTSREEGNQLVD